MSDSTRDTLTELGERARVIVEELARKAAERRETSAATADEPVGPAATADVAGLGRRLGELRACVGEVADVLEATVERLETVEHQLGDPDENLEHELRDGLERCERVLMGIELRVERASAAASPPDPAQEQPRPVGAPVVLVVAPSSERRARLCLALEHHGLRALAACDLAVALALSARRRPTIALLDLDDGRGGMRDLLDEWMEYQGHGNLPRAAVLDPEAGPGAARGFPSIRSEHGAAAMAACLVRLAEDETPKQEQQG